MYPLRKLKTFVRQTRVQQVQQTPVYEYEHLYETHAQVHNTDDAVGAGEYERIGKIELDVLLMEGLKPHHTLLDFGCGNGRLAVHAVRALSQGVYVGTDISRTLLHRAHERISALTPRVTCQVTWQHQNSPRYPAPTHSVDMMCAFSVFTHLENEDTYHYLCDARRVVRPGGKFIFSCLPLNTGLGQHIFMAEAAMELAARWSRVRNVTTSMELMSDLSRMAGWKVVRWYKGDEANIGLPGGEMQALGQSCCVLEAPQA